MRTQTFHPLRWLEGRAVSADKSRHTVKLKIKKKKIDFSILLPLIESLCLPRGF